MVLNTQSYMWDGMGWVGYLLGPTFRAPYGANKIGLPETGSHSEEKQKENESNEDGVGKTIP